MSRRPRRRRQVPTNLINGDLLGGRWSSHSTNKIEKTLQEALLSFNRKKTKQVSASDSWARVLRESEDSCNSIASFSSIDTKTLTRDTSVSISKANFAFDSAQDDAISHDFESQPGSQAVVPRQTKIVCAIGPACRDVSTLVRMLDAGMNVARLNFSHETIAYHTESVRNLRKALSLRPNHKCAILMDTKGPEIRTGALLNGSPIQLVAEQLLVITTDITYVGCSVCVSCTYRGLAESTHVGASLLCADGSLSFEVLYCAPNGGALPDEYKMQNGEEGGAEDKEHNISTVHTSSPYIVVKVKNEGMLGERKNMCLPGVKIPSNMLPSLTKKDVSDLMSFAYQQKVDIVSCSLVRNAQDLRDVRNCLDKARVAYHQQMLQEQTAASSSMTKIVSSPIEYKSKMIRVHAKIENLHALQNIDEIIQEADGVHVSRGDLGMALPLYKVFLAQKMIINQARKYGKPVVTSTEMLDSMISNISPSHAECTDVANAVLDGTDAMMLSGEVANGKYPVSSVLMMARIAKAAESCVDHHDEFLSMRQLSLSGSYGNNGSSNGCGGGGGGGGGGGIKNVNGGYGESSRARSEVIAASAVDTAFKLGAKLIIVFTISGEMPMQVAKYRPGIPIVAVSCNSASPFNDGLVNQLDSLSRGVCCWTYAGIVSHKKGDVNKEKEKDEKTLKDEKSENIFHQRTKMDHLPSMFIINETMNRAAELGWIMQGDAVVSLWARNDYEFQQLDMEEKMQEVCKEKVGKNIFEQNISRCANDAVKYVQSVNYYGY